MQKLLKSCKKNPREWKKIVAGYEEHLAADSNRFEADQIPGVRNAVLKMGSFTAPEKNETDNTTAFAYILKVYPEQEPRNFADAKGLVINDYQAELEEKWLNELRVKYPVKINQQALADVKKGN